MQLETKLILHAMTIIPQYQAIKKIGCSNMTIVYLCYSCLEQWNATRSLYTEPIKAFLSLTVIPRQHELTNVTFWQKTDTIKQIIFPKAICIVKAIRWFQYVYHYIEKGQKLPIQNLLPFPSSSRYLWPLKVLSKTLSPFPHFPIQTL